MKLFISQPMNDLSETEILEAREKAINDFIKKYNQIEENTDAFITRDNIDVLNTYFDEDAPEGTNPGLYYLSKSIEALSHADAAYFATDWMNYRGCVIEEECANKYMLPCYYADNVLTSTPGFHLFKDKEIKPQMVYEEYIIPKFYWKENTGHGILLANNSLIRIDGDVIPTGVVCTNRKTNNNVIIPFDVPQYLNCFCNDETLTKINKDLYETVIKTLNEINA